MARTRYSFTTQQHQDLGLFETSLTTPAVGSSDSLSKIALIQDVLPGWDKLRNSGIKPLNVSKLEKIQSYRVEFLVGCHALGLIGRNKSLKPQQLLVADVCNAPNPYIGMLMPRRSTKTTSLFALALGRCFERPDYLVGYAACTTGLKGRDRFKKDIVPALERVFPDEKQRQFRIVRSGGSERIEFANGSIFQVLPPEGEKFRSDAFDLIIFDEAGEASPGMSEDLIAGALPTFDTRPDAQLIIAGTAAKYRQGNLLWDQLEAGRAKDKRTGILEYAAPDSTSEEDLNDWATVKRLVMKSHPGIGTLTTLEVVRERWERLTRVQFAAEYLSIFGTTGATSGIVNLPQWLKAANTGELPEPPKTFALAFAVHPDQISACVVAVWRTKENRAQILVIDHRRGVDWLAKRVKELGIKYRMPVAHDTNGPVTVEAEILARMRPKPRLFPQTFPNIKTSAALLVKEIELGNIEHFNQDPMNEAVRLAVKRSVGPTAWAFGRKRPEDDIICLEAAAIALRLFDEGPRAAIMPSAAA